jgi:hypothetical protein
VKEDCLRITAGEPTPMQLLAWQRLWALLLAPIDSKSPATGRECTEKPDPATPGGQGLARRNECDWQDAQPNEE